MARPRSSARAANRPKSVWGPWLAVLLPMVAAPLPLFGCGPGSEAQPDGMVRSPSLEAVGAGAIGLRYGEAGTLTVRLLDGQGGAVAGAMAGFGLVGDAGGSTLSEDRAVTDEAGEAHVQVLAGAAEAAFHVVVSSAGAADLSFSVTVSSHPFVDLEAKLAYVGVGMGQVARLRGRLYGDRPCAGLPTSASVPGGVLRDATAEGSTATLSFPFLLARDYALVGAAESEDGRLLAYGCVDVQAVQLAQGGGQVVPVPLAPVMPTLTGRFAVTTTLTLTGAATPASSLTPAWTALTACPAGPAQPLLDGMVAALGDDPMGVALAGARASLDEQGCRPTVQAGLPTLDGALQTLLAPAGSPAELLPAVVADLDAITASATLHSTLTLTPAPAEGDGYRGTHALDGVDFAVPGGASVSYEIAALGLPLPWARLGVTLDGNAVRLGAHGLTLRLPTLWRRALVELALTPRGLPGDPTSLARAMVDAAMGEPGDAGAAHTGCSAVEDLVCAALGRDSPCGMAAACEGAVAMLAQGLDADLGAPTGIDLRLAGTGTAEDGDGDLAVDTITAGGFEVQLGLAMGHDVTLEAAWSATRDTP